MRKQRYKFANCGLTSNLIPPFFQVFLLVKTGQLNNVSIINNYIKSKNIVHLFPVYQKS